MYDFRRFVLFVRRCLRLGCYSGVSFFLTSVVYAGVYSPLSVPYRVELPEGATFLYMAGSGPYFSSRPEWSSQSVVSSLADFEGRCAEKAASSGYVFVALTYKFDHNGYSIYNCDGQFTGTTPPTYVDLGQVGVRKYYCSAGDEVIGSGSSATCNEVPPPPFESCTNGARYPFRAEPQDLNIYTDSNLIVDSGGGSVTYCLPTAPGSSSGCLVQAPQWDISGQGATIYIGGSSAVGTVSGTCQPSYNTNDPGIIVYPGIKEGVGVSDLRQLVDIPEKPSTTSTETVTDNPGEYNVTNPDGSGASRDIDKTVITISDSIEKVVNPDGSVTYRQVGGGTATFETDRQVITNADGSRTETITKTTVNARTGDDWTYTVTPNGGAKLVTPVAGSVTTTRTVVVNNYDSNGNLVSTSTGTETSGGSGNGSSGSGNGSGTGTGDGNNQPEQWGSPPSGALEPYQPGDLTYSQVFSDFSDRVSNAAVISTARNFFTVSVSGSCPTWTLPAVMGMPAIPIEAQCSPAMEQIWPLVRAVLLLVAGYVAFRWAFL